MPDGSNDGYNIWVGELGATDVGTGNPVYFNNSTGVMFTSSTNRIWTPFQKEDIKFVLHRKNFTATSGTAVYRNSNTEYLTANNFGGRFTIGEKVYVSNAVNIIASNAATSNSSNAISVVANSTSNAQALFANGSYVYVTSSTGNTTDVRFITSIPNSSHIVVDSILSFTDSNSSVGYLKSNGALFGYISRYAPDTGAVHLERSSANTTSGFGNVVTATANAILIGEESRAKANLVSVDNPVYSVVIPQFSYVSPAGTSVSLQLKGSNTTTNDAVYTITTGDLETFFTDRERTVRSYSNELQAGGGKSVEVTVPMTTVTDKTSPFIDDIKSNVLAIKNVVGNTGSLAGETLPTGGNTPAKYISKRVVLAEGQDAEDLLVYLSAYKPSNTGITVYTKFLNGDDSSGIENKWWTPLNQNTSSAVVSSRIDRNDFTEFVYDMPFRYSVNAASNTAMADYAVYGTFSNTNISSNTITVSNSTPLDIGSLVFYVGTVSNSIANGFYSILTANTTAVRLATAGSSTAVTITPASSAGVASIYVIPQTAFKDRDFSNVVSYYSSTGAQFHSFKTFAIKIAMTSEEGSHIVPRVSDMRAIALQT